MTRGVVLLALFLLYIIELQGLKHVYRLHGQDLLLDVNKPQLDPKTDFHWKFNSTYYVGKISYGKDPILDDNYERRAKLYIQNYSLLLMNIQRNDSGDYIAIVVKGTEKRIAEYKVIVQDPVTPAELTVQAVSKSSDSCNLTVTCSTVDFNISSSFRCDGKNCSQAEEKDLNATKMFSSLIVYLQQDTIYCNHSNKVSWNQTMKVLKSYCETKTVASLATIITASVCVSLLTVFITFGTWKLLK